jgi:hypothetical protein
MDVMNLGEDTDHWWAVVNTILNFRILRKKIP